MERQRDNTASHRVRRRLDLAAMRACAADLVPCELAPVSLRRRHRGDGCVPRAHVSGRPRPGRGDREPGNRLVFDRSSVQSLRTLPQLTRPFQRCTPTAGCGKIRHMLISRVHLKNWRNFRHIDVPLRDTTYFLGPNASGKSNLLDAFRFLRDVSKAKGGGLQTAVADRGGITKLRCLHARRDPEVLIEVEVATGLDEEQSWRYLLAFKPEGKGAQRILVSREEVWHRNKCILQRPNESDTNDPAQLTQTYLEQIQANSKFRELAEFFGSINYLHLVPQLLKFADKLGGHRLDDDPFGQGFLEQIARTPEKTRNARLRKIET